jgi:hypothetical protein
MHKSRRLNQPGGRRKANRMNVTKYSANATDEIDADVITIYDDDVFVPSQTLPSEDAWARKMHALSAE